MMVSGVWDWLFGAATREQFVPASRVIRALRLASRRVVRRDWKSLRRERMVCWCRRWVRTGRRMEYGGIGRLRSVSGGGSCVLR